MKILYACRLFSGLETSVISKKWKPTGVPTIFKVLERLEEHSDLHIFLVQKPGFSKKYYSKDFKFKWEKFKNPINLISGVKYFSFLPRKISFFLSEVRHLFLFTRQILLIKPDIIYFDHSNIITFGILSRIIKTPTVFRVMGVYPYMRNIFDKSSFRNSILKVIYRSPFTLSICTQDGSGIEPWLNKAINQKTDKFELINGVPRKFKENQSIKKNKEFKVTFIGKLESPKGAYQFIESAILFIKTHTSNIKFQIIGDGSLREILRNKVISEGFQHLFDFYHNVDHDEIINYLIDTDIYVSLNKFGNLSNANLEAIAMNKCIIIPKSQPDIGVDLILDKLFSVDSIYRIDSQKDIVGLSNAISLFYNDYKLRKLYEKNLNSISINLLTWEERIQEELIILINYAKKKQ